MINNISTSNMEAKTKEFNEVLQEQYCPWFAQYMVMKRLAYLHEGLEPKVVHRDIKSSNILDQQWNAKVSDFGLAKLLYSERSYVAPEYASTGMLNERSDVYSFGVLIMVITGRSLVDYTRAPGEVNLVEWLKTTVAERKAEQVVDPKLAEKPSPKALKRTLLVTLRCVDPMAAPCDPACGRRSE